ncbi:MAG: YdeI/OmpD-associated family protein [Oscillospiraceae bacterium]|nr:YdeI/OmpD-associated family protein [Oscillospiraceae bacterium]
MLNDTKPVSGTDLRDGKKIFHCEDRQQWREWLFGHFETEKEIWFVFPAKSSGEKGLSYNDAVEEALCFGWIDGRAGTLDNTHQLRRFTPRRKGSAYSRPNIERLIRMDEKGAIHPKIRPSVENLITAPFVFPEDILDEIRKDGDVWKNFEAFPEPYKRIRTAYIDSARDRPEEFRKRLANFIKRTGENKLIMGYGGIDKYYGSYNKPTAGTRDIEDCH